MAEIPSSGSVDFTNPDTPSSGMLADFDAEKAAAQEAAAREAVQLQWAQAIATDERVHNRHSPSGQSGRHRSQSRPWDEREHRRRERAQQERHRQCLAPQATPRQAPDHGTYAMGKTRTEVYFGQFLSGFFRALGLE